MRISDWSSDVCSSDLFIQGLLGCDPVVAKQTQKRYFLEHGTTLSGLMHHHGIEPRAFLDYVHDISMDRLEVDEALNAHIAALQIGRASCRERVCQYV